MEEITKDSNFGGLPLKKLQAVKIQASETKNYNENYVLSNLDHLYSSQMIETIYCYKSDEKNSSKNEKNSSKNVASVIKDALSNVLVYYYPLAGTLMIGDDGKCVVKCTNKGVPFVEAEADCEIDVLGDIQIPDPALLGNLVYTFPQKTSISDLPFLSIQVTRFKCGGFVLGLVFSHMMADGISAMEFVNSWAKIARGELITDQPYLDRRVLKSRQPPLIKYSHDEYQKIDDISGIDDLYEKEKNVLESFTFDREKINALKRIVMQDGEVKSCTSFTILTALIWRSRCKALKMKQNQIAKIIMAVDGSKHADSKIPKDYFGNRVCMVSCACLAGELMEKPLSFAVEMLQNSIKQVTWDYVRSVIDYIEVNGDNASICFPTTLLVSSWGRLDFHSTDFGWGEPYQTGMTKCLMKELLLFLPIGNNENGITVLLCLPETAMQIFKTEVQI